MAKWEYYVKDFDTNPGSATVWPNAKADEGWELVNMFPDTASQKWIVVMKKEKYQPSKTTGHSVPL